MVGDGAATCSATRLEGHCAHNCPCQKTWQEVSFWTARAPWLFLQGPLPLRDDPGQPHTPTSDPATVGELVLDTASEPRTHPLYPALMGRAGACGHSSRSWCPRCRELGVSRNKGL